MAISTGLAHYTIHSILKGSTHSRLNKLFEVTSPKDNFQNLRELYKNAFPPFIPPQVVLSRDLMFIEEANKTWIDEEKSLINVDKIVLIGRILLRLEKNRYTSYTFGTIKFFERYLRNIQVLSEPELEDLSSKLGK